MGDFEKIAASFLGGIFTLSILSVLLSRNANTVAVVSSTGSAISSVVTAAEAPVTQSGSSFGSSASVNTSSLFNSSNLNFLGNLSGISQ